MISKALIVHMTSVHMPSDVRIARKECASLKKLGYDVRLLAPVSDSSERPEGIYVKAIRSYSSRLLRMIITASRILYSAIRMDARLYHIHDPELLPLAALILKKKAVVIYDMHENMYGSILTKPWIPQGMRKVVATLYRSFERWLLRDVPVIYAEWSYRFDYPGIKVFETVLNMPLKDELINLPLSARKEHPTICYVGAISPLRGIWTILSALRILKKTGLEIHFECIGRIEPNLKKRVEAYCRREGLFHVKIYGYTAPESAWRMASACHIGISVLKDTPNYINSYPTKMFEYMALGLPVIVSDFPLLRAVVEVYKCGICVHPDDPRQIANAIRSIIVSPDEAVAMGKRGRDAVVNEFNWNCEAQKLASFYSRLLTEQ